MGSSSRYSSASELAKNEDKSEIADASGSSPISANADILRAIARVGQSLKTVLAHIATIQREMGIDTSLNPDVPLKPDDTWNGTP